MRKDFTTSERVAIARAIEERLSQRNGVRHDSAPAMEKFPEVHGLTRDLAAKKTGFGSGKTLEAAKRVIEHGTPCRRSRADERQARKSCGIFDGIHEKIKIIFL